MNKQQFLYALRRALDGVPESEVEKSLAFYEESINDRMEDGMSEWEAVSALGDIDAIAEEIKTSLPLSTIVRQRVKNSAPESSGGKALWIILAIIGFPVWLPLLLAVIAVILSVYLTIWVAVISVYAVLLALILSALAALVYLAVRFTLLGTGGALMLIGTAAVLAGLALVLFAPLCLLAKGIAKLTVRFGRWLKGLFIRKGGKA